MQLSFSPRWVRALIKRYNEALRERIKMPPDDDHVAGGRFALLIDRQARRFAALNTRGVYLQRARSAGLNCGDDATCGDFWFAVCAKLVVRVS
jgi:hypothetical protein